MTKKITKTALKRIIKEMILNELPQLTKFGTGAKFNPDLTKQKIKDARLKEGKPTLKYPDQKDIDHEVMRIKTLYKAGYADQYERRIGKINKPQKMYCMYLACLQWKIKHPEDKKNMEKYAGIARLLLRKWGYSHLPVGRGGHINVDINERKK